MQLTVADILQLEIMQQAELVAGHAGQDRPVRWVHTWPEVLSWFHGGELLLTTGYSWPESPADQRRIVRELHTSNIAALLFQTGRYFPDVPPAVLEAADALKLLRELLTREQARLRQALAYLREPRTLAAVDGLASLTRQLPVDPIVAPVRTSGELLGFLWIVQRPGAVEELDVRAAEHGAIVAGLHLLRQRA